MKRGRLPLTALRSFEAAGRLGSFTLAADELSVSQAAVSRQVKELEAENARLKRIVADQQISIDILKEANSKKW